MAASRSIKPKSKSKALEIRSDWVELTWDDLGEWAGSRTLARGRSYQRGGRVKNLAISKDGALLATVQGTTRYTTTVVLKPGRKQRSLESSCTCPVGISCKHAVAVVAEYLKEVADGVDIPLASDNDPRWAKLVDSGQEEEEWGDDDWNGDDDEVNPRRASVGRGRAAVPRSSGVDWSAKIESYIRSRSRSELADLVWSLVQRYDDLHQEFRERIALQEGDVGQLVAEARHEIREVTSILAWRNHWDGTGDIPDYSKIRHRLERLLELGHADEVVALGRDLIVEGMRQVGEAHDEGETSIALASSLAVVFQAVMRSSLSGPERLLYVIGAELDDGYDVLNETVSVVLDATFPSEDWSTVADTLLQRLKPVSASVRGDDFSRNYQRDRLTNWIAMALNNSGREAELRALYESEALATSSYERIVSYLMNRQQFDEAATWARKGIAATAEKWPGIANHLATKLCEIARGRRQWDVVAAHAALAFFDDYPRVSAFEELMKAARKAKVEPAVRSAALHFLETGVRPYEVISPKPNDRTVREPARRPTHGKRGAKTSARASSPEPVAEPPIIVSIDPDWPLPVLDELIPFLEHSRRYNAEPRPHREILLEMAIAANQPDRVLHWFDRMRSASRKNTHGNHWQPHAERVAAAVADTHPERALEIYKAALDAQLPHAQVSAYESATSLLRKLRPIHEALGRPDEWAELVASIRERYRNRPRFMELLDRIDGRTIVQSTRTRRK